MNYSDIEDAFMFVSMASPYEHEAYLDKETGETFYVSSLGESDELPDDLEESDKYISVPHKKAVRDVDAFSANQLICRTGRI